MSDIARIEKALWVALTLGYPFDQNDFARFAGLLRVELLVGRSDWAIAPGGWVKLEFERGFLRRSEWAGRCAG